MQTISPLCHPLYLGKKGITNALPIGNKIEADNQGKLDNPAPKVPNICVAKCV